MKSSKRQKSRKTRKIKTKGLNELNNSSPVQLCMNAMTDKEKLQKKTGGFGKKVGNECMEDLQQTQVGVCDVCGDNGFSNALIYCSKCSDTAVHQYCLGISPGSIDDTYNWFCEYCCPSMEFEHLDTSGATFIRTEEGFEELAVPLELQSDQCRLNGIIDVDEVEPLCTLLPLLPQGSSEHMETHNQCQIAEVIPRMATTVMTHSANHMEECESSVSSFMESPKEIMSGLVLLASASGKIIICGGMSICPHLATSTVNITGSCNEMNPDKLVVGDECAVQKTAELGDCSPRMDKEIDASYSNEDGGFCKGAVDACQENTSEDTNVREVIDMGLPAVGNGSLHWIKRKRTETLAICDLIPSIGSECKRARSKRCKMPPSLSKEVDACKRTITDVCTIGKESGDQPVNGHEVITVGNMIHGTSQPQTLNSSPLRDGLQVDAFNQECGLFDNMVECGSDVKETTFEVDDRLNDQEMTKIHTSILGLDSQRLPLSNVSLTRDLAMMACGQQSEKGFPLSQGIGQNEALKSTNIAFSPRLEQAPTYIDHIHGGETRMVISLSCKGSEKGFEKITGVEEVRDDNTPPFEERSNLMHCGVSFSKSTMQTQHKLCSSNLSSLMLESPSSMQILCEELMESNVVKEKPLDELDEVDNNVKKLRESITCPDAWKEYDIELEKLKAKIEGEKKKMEEVIKKNRLRMWKVVYELETTKKELQEKMVELAKKTVEVELAKDLVLKGGQDLTQKKEAYKLWLGGYSTAESVIFGLHPELNRDNIKAVRNLMLLRYC